MKEITINFEQAIRLAFILSDQSGTRKDPKIRIYQEVLERLDIPDEKRAQFTRSFPGGVILSSDVATQPDQKLELTRTEARYVSEALDNIQIKAGDFRWLDPLAKALDCAC